MMLASRSGGSSSAGSRSRTYRSQSRMIEPDELVQDCEKLTPCIALLRQNAAAQRCQAIKPAAALPGLLNPAPFHPSPSLHAVEQRVKRGYMKLKFAVGLRLNQFGNFITVARAVLQQSQDDHL